MSPNAITSLGGDALVGAQQGQRRGLGDAGAADLEQRGRGRPGHHGPVADGRGRGPRTPGASSSCRASSLTAGHREELLQRAARAPSGSGWRRGSRTRARCRPGSRPRTRCRARPRGSGRRPRGRRPGRSGAGGARRSGDVPDQRAVGDDRQPVAADVLEDVLGPAQRAAGDEDDRDAPAVELREHLAGVGGHRAVGADQGAVEVGRDQPGSGRLPGARVIGATDGPSRAVVLVGSAELGEAAPRQHPQAGGWWADAGADPDAQPVGLDEQRAQRLGPKPQPASRRGRTRPRPPGPAGRGPRPEEPIEPARSPAHVAGPTGPGAEQARGVASSGRG